MRRRLGLEVSVCREVRRLGKDLRVFKTSVIYNFFSFHRVALARAVYARTKYVLLDDPLSAVVSCLIILSGPNLIVLLLT